MSNSQVNNCHSIKFNHNIYYCLHIGLKLNLNIKARIVLANHIGLRCSSHSNNLHNVEFRFKYTSRTGKNFTAACLANQSRPIHHNHGHWLVYRMQKSPYDCILAIQNISYDYSGAYECVGFFLVDGKIEKVSSNHVGLTEEDNVVPPSFKPSGKDMQIYLPIFIVVTLVSLLFVITCIWRNHNKLHRTQPTPVAYGSTGAAALLASGQRTAVIGGAAALLANNPVGQGDARKAIDSELNN